MNSSLEIQRTIPSECSIYVFIGGIPDQFSTLVYVVVFNIILVIITWPFTIVLNLLVMIAVKTKARLQSMSNIALACLASTDALVGVLAQPLYIYYLVTTLLCETKTDVCPLQNVVRNTMNFFGFSSLAHLVLMTADRFLAIKHTFTYEQIVTKVRVLVASAVVWIFTAAVHIVLLIDFNLFIPINNALIVTFILMIIICNVIVYRETRRHERQIAQQQVSVEARENFLKEKRALKLTTIIIVIVMLSYLPTLSFRMIKNALKDIVSIDTIYAIYYSAATLVTINSFINPLIYSIRLRQFRVAYIELLLKKNHLEAEEFERKVFGSPNAVANQGGEREEQDVNGVNTINSNLDTNQGGEREEQV